MIRRPPRSTPKPSSAASDVYKRQVLYVLDEPSIGLHQRDNDKLIATLKNLRDLGNTVIVVEHDEDTMRSADYIVDVGPGAGVHGGEIVAAGSVKDICKAKRSITGDYLSGRKRIAVPQTRRTGNGNYLTVRGARENNLRNICLLYTSPSPRDGATSRMPSSA